MGINAEYMGVVGGRTLYRKVLKWVR